MFMTLTAVGSFGMVIAMVWLGVAIIMLAFPTRRARFGWHAARASIALLLSVAAVSFGGTQVYRDFGFANWSEMITHFRSEPAPTNSVSP